MLTKIGNGLYDLLDGLRGLDFLAPLALRLYLAPVFWVSGMNKLANFPDIVSWFGDGLGLPAPTLMAALATGAEVGGAVMLLAGLGTRLISVPLMVTMVVAAVTVHWDHGWQAVHDLKSPFASQYTLSLEGDKADEALERLDRARSILQEHGHYDWLTERGNFIVSNNGIEWSATYFVMLLALFFMGSGRWLSLDHWLSRAFRS